jgi:hypothetical protein
MADSPAIFPTLSPPGKILRTRCLYSYTGRKVGIADKLAYSLAVDVNNVPPAVDAINLFRS